MCRLTPRRLYKSSGFFSTESPKVSALSIRQAVAIDGEGQCSSLLHDTITLKNPSRKRPENRVHCISLDTDAHLPECELKEATPAEARHNDTAVMLTILGQYPGQAFSVTNAAQ